MNMIILFLGLPKNSIFRLSIIKNRKSQNEIWKILEHLLA
jgi:hypothetical protein